MQYLRSTVASHRQISCLATMLRFNLQEPRIQQDISCRSLSKANSPVREQTLPKTRHRAANVVDLVPVPHQDGYTCHGWPLYHIKRSSKVVAIPLR